MWESFSPEAQERILRLLGRAIARILNQEEERCLEALWRSCRLRALTTGNFGP